jgi:NarL family two-component system sensor histidine kinase LiaS
MGRLRKLSPRSLRWKLTWSYTVVTVGALLAVVTLAVPCLFLYVLVPAETLNPEYLIETLNERYMPHARDILSQSPPDYFAAQVLLNDLDDATLSNITLVQIGDARFSIQTNAQLAALLIDADGLVWAVTTTDHTSEGVVGELLDPNLVPELIGPLHAALAGEQDPRRLSAYREWDDSLIVAVPVPDEDGNVLGALCLLIESLPTQQDLPAYTATTMCSSLLLFTLAAGVMGTAFGALTARGFLRRFRRLSEATNAWSQGDFSASVDDTSGDELGQLTRQMNQMATQLHTLLEERQEVAVLEERNRLARDLHDSAKQRALAAAAQLGAVGMWLDQNPGEAKAHLDEARKLVDEVRHELHDLIYQLRPAELEDKSLVTALREYVADWARRNDIAVDVQIKDTGVIPLRVAHALFRVAQEALSNIARHSHAGNVVITLSHEPNVVNLIISDDGQGFDIESPKGLGLHSMRERIEAFGGNLVVESDVGHGTKVVANWMSKT